MTESETKLLYLVVPAKLGWSVNLGADSLVVFATLEDARAEAERRVAEALARGEASAMMEHSQGGWPDGAL
jgi:hypothetical protein